MKVYILPRSIERVGEIVAKIPYAKQILKPIYYPYKEWLNKKRNHQFLTQGLKVLKSFDECLTRNGINYQLGFGTLLGAVREKGFIKHDLDIDTCMWYNDYLKYNAKECLEKAGFKLIRCFSVEEGAVGMEQTYLFNGVTIDIFLIYEPVKQMPYTCHIWAPVGDTKDKYESMKKYGYLIPYRFEVPYPKDVIRIPFYNILLPIPANYKDILRLRYGEDYMIPNPAWHDSTKYFVPWTEKKAILENLK